MILKIIIHSYSLHKQFSSIHSSRHPCVCNLQPSVESAMALQDRAASHQSSLGDVPFTLAPHLQLRRLCNDETLTAVFLQLEQIDEKLASYAYDFQLELSVLCDP
uniref:UMA domain-containing protein n=1 Tax=Eptatretus burgeri TaxID=7764 RepID=A0A8C4QVE2_EPTBU